MIEGMFDTGAMPVLERVVQFTTRRHKVLLHNIANLSTPNFVPGELSRQSFQAQLGRAIDERRARTGGPDGPLQLPDTRQVRVTPDTLDTHPDDSHDNILFHDRNNRSLEHQMKNLASNVGAHNTALRFLKNEFDMLETAIRERL